MYSPVDITPCKEILETAHPGLVESILTHLRADWVRNLRGYRGILSWDGEVVMGQLEFRLENLTVAECLTELRSRRPQSAAIEARCTDWSTRLWRSLEQIAVAETHDHFVPCNVTIKVGPNEIPDVHLNDTICRTNFSVELHADGMPKYPEAYLRNFTEHPQIKELVTFLEAAAGVKWKFYISCSY